eukprot:GHVS01088304.1.p1 GENE.GHVS01088304.1~~GHVS01088304.1.p1  ORF type:complete len:706 (-),score=170.62 GHVS01088304.1:218-2065(-)
MDSTLSNPFGPNYFASSLIPTISLRHQQIHNSDISNNIDTNFQMPKTFLTTPSSLYSCYSTTQQHDSSDNTSTPTTTTQPHVFTNNNSQLFSYAATVAPTTTCCSTTTNSYHRAVGGTDDVVTLAASSLSSAATGIVGHSTKSDVALLLLPEKATADITRLSFLWGQQTECHNSDLLLPDCSSGSSSGNGTSSGSSGSSGVAGTTGSSCNGTSSGSNGSSSGSGGGSSNGSSGSKVASAYTDNKYMELRYMSKRQPQNNIIYFSKEEYNRFALKSPRPYQLFVAFFDSKKEFCPFCAEFINNYRQVSNAYEVTAKYKAEGRKAPVVFAAFDVQQDISIINLHQMRTIPFMVSIDVGSQDNNSNRRSSSGFIKSGEFVLFQQADMFLPLLGGPLNHDGSAAFSSERILSWINMKTGRDGLTLQDEADAVSARAAVLICCVFVFVSASIAIIYVCRTWPVMRVVGALLVQCVCTGGLFYSVQRGMVLVGFDSASRAIMWVTRSSRSQYALEGIVLSSLLLGCGMVLVAIAHVGKWNSRRSSCSGGGVEQSGASSTTKTRGGRWSGMLSVVCLVIIFIAMVATVFHCFRIKAAWYAPTFWPPYDYITGPLRADRGNEF